ncbi:MAG: PspC domain-containing protein [Eubacterium sp.]|nr:PspC domain-containing protein [Eubacterium sp.]MDE6155583.1 PspC domain-containing protein [Eubacterium sp.]
MKKLYRSKNERMLEGVCGGIAVYFNVDPTIVRLVWALVSIFSAAIPGVLLYIVCSFIIPEEPDAYDTTGYYHEEH